jgi:RND family efflux transporter MFP subunit
MRLLPKCLIAFALTGVAALAVLDRDAGASAPATRPEPPPAVVDVALAVTTAFAPRHWAPGSVISRGDARVASEQGGRLVRIVEVGQQVGAGDALAVLDDTALALREREATAQLARIGSQLALATRQEARYAQLAAQQNIARAQHDQLQAERDVLAQEHAASAATLAQIRHQRRQMTVRAPFPGVVAERLAQPGEYLAAGAAVARVVDTGNLEVRVRAPVELARHLGVGGRVLLRHGGGESTHAITALVPVGDEASRQLELRIGLAEPGLSVGSAVEIGLPRDSERQVLAVPQDALVLRREGSHVLRVDAGQRAERVEVETGEQLDGLVEVRGALQGQALSIQDPARATALR